MTYSEQVTDGLRYTYTAEGGMATVTITGRTADLTANRVREGIRIGALRDAYLAPQRVSSGRPEGRGGVFLARLAEGYVKLIEEGHTRPHIPLAAATGINPGTMKTYISRARERDLLTTTGQGRAGGELTEKAKKILASA